LVRARAEQLVLLKTSSKKEVSGEHRHHETFIKPSRPPRTESHYYRQKSLPNFNFQFGGKEFFTPR
jgi:hypothetical protein